MVVERTPKGKKVRAIIPTGSDSEDDFASSDDESQNVIASKISRPVHRDEEESEEEEEEEEDEEDEEKEGDDVEDDRFAIFKGITPGKKSDEEDEDDVLQDDEDNEHIVDDETITVTESMGKSKTKLGKLKKLTPEQLAQEQKKIKRTGVCYLSRIPPYMKPAKLRSILSRFGEIDRLFLKPEDTAIYQRRVKYGGNKKKNFTEGWVEYVNKKDAKLCEASMNGNIIGGKKSSYYYDDVMNIKYLSGFKWFDLTQQIAKENEIRQAKLSMESSQQQKLNKSFISNVEKSKMVKNIQQKRKARDESQGVDTESKDIEMRRQFKQRKTASTRADADDKLKERAKPNTKLNDVLSKVF
ncbi:pre-rRNA-processing protein Esf2p [[Candida] anglica]|uniref:Pre-rRNA-processing protein ESF2 n=1 Tax=[Candida] anglica TaxID=148631 RepID=A0ABP0EFZ5_9ASCO